MHVHFNLNVYDYFVNICSNTCRIYGETRCLELPWYTFYTKFRYLYNLYCRRAETPTLPTVHAAVYRRGTGDLLHDVQPRRGPGPGPAHHQPPSGSSHRFSQETHRSYCSRSVLHIIVVRCSFSKLLSI